jgi:hypothetical protein
MGSVDLKEYKEVGDSMDRLSSCRSCCYCALQVSMDFCLAENIDFCLAENMFLPSKKSMETQAKTSIFVAFDFHFVGARRLTPDK